MIGGQKVGVRELKGEELAGEITKLRTLVYPHVPEAADTEWHASVWRWLNKHPLADHMRRWVVVAGDQVVGHLAATPQYYRIDGERVVAYTPADYQILPQYGFYALSLMRTFFRYADSCVACDMVPAVIQVESRLGAEVAGDLHYAAKLLNVSRLPVPQLPEPVKRFLNLQDEQPAPVRGYENVEPPLLQEQAMPPLRPRVPIPGPAKWLLNRGLQAMDETLDKRFEGRSGSDLEVEVIEEFDESFDRLFESVAASVPCIPEKDAAFLHWRYGPDSPQSAVTVLGVRDGDRLLGYAVLGITVKGREGFRDGYILDLMTLPGRQDVARALLRAAVPYFRQAGVPIIRYRFLMSPTTPRSEDLWRLGFFYRNSRRNTLLVNLADKRLNDIARDTGRWSYTIGDGEATFWLKLS